MDAQGGVEGEAGALPGAAEVEEQAGLGALGGEPLAGRPTTTLSSPSVRSMPSPPLSTRLSASPWDQSVVPAVAPRPRVVRAAFSTVTREPSASLKSSTETPALPSQARAVSQRPPSSAKRCPPSRSRDVGEAGGARHQLAPRGRGEVGGEAGEREPACCRRPPRRPARQSRPLSP